MASFIEDRDLVMSILARFKELMEDESTKQKYDQRMDPNKADPTKLIAIVTGITDECAVMALSDHGVDPEKLTGRLTSLVMKHYGNDKEVLELMSFMAQKGARSWIGNLKVGDTRPDVDLVAIETKEKISLSDLHINKERPLVIVSGSIS
ncbi:uncharacterized protein [Ptychodera flava]|uniref:uncharacterized protein n=1 Tax=Ptychodera flava TaxID=63121 RepID=UPI003969E9A5